MACNMLIQLPVTVPFGTDEEFDLRVRLQRELSEALARAGMRCPVSGEIDAEHINLWFDGTDDAERMFGLVKPVLAAAGLLDRAVVILESPSPYDPDEQVSWVLWPPDHAEALPAG